VKSKYAIGCLIYHDINHHVTYTQRTVPMYNMLLVCLVK
jgi:hypothetical protein